MVGMVWEATTMGYRHFCSRGLQFMATARARPRTTEIRRPMQVTAMVAGRWTVNRATRSSQSRFKIWIGVGRM